MEPATPISRIGVVSGVEAELSAFLPTMPRSRVSGCPLPIEHIAWAGKDVFLLCAGIGKVAAATAATALRAYCDVELLVVIGTAGKIGAVEGELFHIAEAVQADFGAQRPDGLVHYTAGAWPIGPAEVRAFTAMPLAGSGLPAIRIATSDLFIECSVHAGRVREALGAALVDMETAAVAQAAGLLGVPWIAVKATTDGADGDSGSAFVANLQAAARAAALAAEDLIAGL